jgi:hypothetical protein
MSPSNQVPTEELLRVLQNIIAQAQLSVFSSTSPPLYASRLSSSLPPHFPPTFTPEGIEEWTKTCLSFSTAISHQSLYDEDFTREEILQIADSTKEIHNQRVFEALTMEFPVDGNATTLFNYAISTRDEVLMEFLFSALLTITNRELHLQILFTSSSSLQDD